MPAVKTPHWQTANELASNWTPPGFHWHLPSMPDCLPAHSLHCLRQLLRSPECQMPDALAGLQLLRRFSKDAVALRLKHLSLVRMGAESHTIVVMVRCFPRAQTLAYTWRLLHSGTVCWLRACATLGCCTFLQRPKSCTLEHPLTASLAPKGSTDLPSQRTQHI